MKNETRPEDAAFARPWSERTLPQAGLTKREEFAKAAMQGILSGSSPGHAKAAAKWALECADELIKALNATPVKD